ncbi:uncharacterized protein Z518_08672 [Rhinocladiella mackenziei CBS 650.93]|uniref:Flavin-containing monooxygenase n=1 Tax=Rhinocladiella mackenziei CBS 650.93 TaxID=1442369 RepID=A0A0D2J1F1_9EURO|nr:uncharacterized protein Z518_08672 [Rhinocladiella mackenziei CBS 650.93]KIX02730.1 hypothetical protein Z518_08672 [Rhinocladiella mackenziei CBS 650.93]
MEIGEKTKGVNLGRVAVVGAGPLGLMAMKNMMEDGFDVTGFEKRGYVGGLWKSSTDSSISVTETTVFNSSRFRSAISDFPFPEGVDDYPSAKQIHQYMESYCDHFKLRPHIHLNTTVNTFSRVDGKWALEVVHDGSSRIEYFDKLLTCSGSFVTPRIPKLQNVEKFQGPILHSIEFPHPSRFKDQNVLLIGLHATAQDLTVELSQHAQKVYIAHKNGIVLVPRFTEDGRALDQGQNLSFLFFQVFMTTWFPNLFNWLIDKILARMSKKAFAHQPEEWNLSPAPSIATTSPMVADAIYPFLENGFATPISPVKQIVGPKSIQLTDGRVLDDVDTIIYCTGYDFSVPFVPKEYNPYPVVGGPPSLYRNIFPLHPDPAVRNSLAFLGQCGFAFPGFVQFELSAMAVSQIWLGRSQLPSLDKMKHWHRDQLAWRESVLARSKFDSNFYPVFVPLPDQMRWLDETAGTGIFQHFSTFSWKSWRFWWSDPKFYKLCVSGLFSPSIWRLFDMGRRKPWPDAKRQVIEDNEYATKRVAERLVAMKKLEVERKQK